MTSLAVIAAASVSSPAGAESIARDPIQQEVRRSLPSIRRCYDQSLVRNPATAGRVTLQLVIGTDGRVRSVFVSTTTITDSAMLDCLVERARRWRFLPNEAGDVTVRYPFHFAPAR